jgi:hypothetical protein
VQLVHQAVDEQVIPELPAQLHQNGAPGPLLERGRSTGAGWEESRDRGASVFAAELDRGLSASAAARASTAVRGTTGEGEWLLEPLPQSAGRFRSRPLPAAERSIDATLRPNRKPRQQEAEDQEHNAYTDYHEHNHGVPTFVQNDHLPVAARRNPWLELKHCSTGSEALLDRVLLIASEDGSRSRALDARSGHALLELRDLPLAARIIAVPDRSTYFTVQGYPLGRS